MSGEDTGAATAHIAGRGTDIPRPMLMICNTNQSCADELHLVATAAAAASSGRRCTDAAVMRSSVRDGHWLQVVYINGIYSDEIGPYVR